MRNKCVTSLLIAGMCLLASGAASADPVVTAVATTIVVNTLEDELNNNGDCSLREAVQAVNLGEPVDACPAGSGNDTITFDTSLLGQTIVLDLAGPGEDDNASGDLDIKLTQPGGSIVITGPGTGADSIIIDGGAQAGLSAPDRIFHILGSANTARLEFSNLTLQNGSVGEPQSPSFSSGGGAILAEYDDMTAPHQIALFRLENVAIINNTMRAGFGGAGGGVFVDNVDALEITDSTISGNVLNSSGLGTGGGFFVQQAGPVSVTGSEFSDNSVSVSQGSGDGGGFAVGTQSFGSATGGAASVDIDQSQFNGNSVTTDAVSGSDSGPDASGGGVSLVSVSGALTITNSSFNTNTLDVSTTTFSGNALGGGLYAGSAGQVSVTQADFNENSATVTDGSAQGGGIYLGGATAFSFTGGGANNNKLTTVLGSNQRGGSAEGGGLWTQRTGLEINSAAFSGNKVSAANNNAEGGGLHAKNLDSLSIDTSQFSNNILGSSRDAEGGGVWLRSILNTLTITNSEFANNDNSADLNTSGGGLYLNNEAYEGFFNPASLSMATTQVAANSIKSRLADARGAGMWLSTSSPVNIDTSEFSDNTSVVLGSPSGNSNDPGPVAYGGGLYVMMGSCNGGTACVQLENSTLSGNTLTAAQARGDGAGLFVLTAFSKAIAGLNNVTLANNIINANSGNGGGLAAADSVTLQTANSLIATNSAGNGPDCVTSISGDEINQPGTIVSLGYNLLGNPTGCGFTPADGDLTGNETQAIDPLLGPLGDNGGPTRTHLLLTGSPAIDVGNPDTPTGEIPNCMVADQRGDVRPQDGNGNGAARCDIGALERTAVANAPPTVVEAIGDRTLQPNDDSITIDLSNVFSDPENEPLTYSVTSSNPASVLASISAAQLTISPIDNGVATVEVTATDPLGATATDSPVITIANEAPVVDNAIPDQGLSANGSPESFDLNTVFSDPENDPLTFTAQSSNPAVVSVSIDGNLLIIAPGSAGNATVSVTASDDLEAATTDQFGVNVAAGGNQPPNIVSPIPDQSQRVGSGAVTIDLSTVFSDPDDDPLNFIVTTSAPDVVTAELQGNNLKLTPVAVGNASINVKAFDPSEAAVTDTFVFAVTNANRAPTVIGQIPDQSLQPNSKVSVDLTQFFEDPDGDPLFFSATSSNTGVVSVDINSDGLLTLTAGVPGSASVTVTARDPAGAQALSRVRIGGNSSSLAGSSGGGCVMTGPGNASFDPMLLLLLGLSIFGVALARFRRTGGGCADHVS